MNSQIQPTLNKLKSVLEILEFTKLTEEEAIKLFELKRKLIESLDLNYAV